MKLTVLLCLFSSILYGQCESPILVAGKSLAVIDRNRSNLYQWFCVNGKDTTSYFIQGSEMPQVKKGSRIWVKKLCTPEPLIFLDGFDFISYCSRAAESGYWMTSNTITIK